MRPREDWNEEVEAHVAASIIVGLAIRRLRRLLARPTSGSLASLAHLPPPLAPLVYYYHRSYTTLTYDDIHDILHAKSKLEIKKTEFYGKKIVKSQTKIRDFFSGKKVKK